jgi:hypothetical protein
LEWRGGDKLARAVSWCNVTTPEEAGRNEMVMAATARATVRKRDGVIRARMDVGGSPWRGEERERERKRKRDV